MRKDKTEIFELATPCKVEFRPIMIAEENYMAQAKKSKKSGTLDRALDEVLNRCTTQVVDPGPYSFLSEGGRPNWHDMLTGDRFSAMFALRKHSYKDGHLYIVENVTCACGMVWDHEFDIDEDLEQKRLSEESLEKLKAGEAFEFKIDDKVVRFNLQTGKTRELFDKLKRQRPGRNMAAGIRARIVEVEGLEKRDIMDWLDGNNGQSKTYTGLSSDDGEEIRAAFDEVDCGVDTEVEAECPDCGRFVRFDLPFDGIFLPGRKIRERKRARRGTAFSAR